MQPLVSIITVTRNLIDAGRKDFFRQSVESVRMQDYPNIEHLIIDGASMDGTIDLLKEMKVNYISEPDTGVYNAFNKGIKKSKGKYIAFLNSDDFYSRKDAVSLSVNALEKRNADFSFACYEIIELENNKSSVVPVRWDTGFVAMPSGHPTVFSRKYMLETLGGFDESYRIISDFDLITRALLKGFRAVEIPQSIATFRLGGLTSSSAYSIVLRERLRIIETNCGVSHKQAVRAARDYFLPKKTLHSLLAKTVDFPDAAGVYKYNRYRFFKYLKKQFLTFRIRKKGKRCIRLLGITFYDEGKL